jgi:predicted RNase H-like HicB family nuclease
MNFTAKYTKIPTGYMGQIVEWPEVITEGRDIEECRSMIVDALNEMILAYKDLNKDLPETKILFEQIRLDIEYVS